ncbi:response regulator [Pseudosulfitobacter sp. SM2401]|uniref:response regulator n=1 Tax=Pseudosulfitobacter sp. SM2401 TaxID=3350098 RepID=UPI0036F2EA8B
MHHSAAAHAKSSESFLIVEDSLFDQERITRILARNFQSADLQYASTLEDAREILQTQRFSMILLDNNLPDGTGANFALELAEDPELSEIPVIMISDWPSPFMWHKAQTAGVKFVLKKNEFHAGYVQFGLMNKSRAAGAMAPGFSALASKLSAPGPSPE